MGEAEYVWSQLLQDLESERLQPVYQASRLTDGDSIPSIRRDIFQAKRYLFRNIMQASRGCPYHCEFCVLTESYGHTYRARPIADIVTEVTDLGGRVVGFVDDNIVGDPRRAADLFSALKPLGIRWISQATVNFAEREDLVAAAAESGCIGLGIGFESIYPASLAEARKTQNSVERYLDLVHRLHRYGIAIGGNFMFGFDNDDSGVFERTLQFATLAQLEFGLFSVMTPYPGTPLYERLSAEGRIFNRNWADYTGGKAVFLPKRMSPETLERGTTWVRSQFYTWGSIRRRVGLRRPYVIPLWLANLGHHVVNRMHWLRNDN